MRVAVLTAGPSVLRTWSAEMARDYDTVVAVNSALIVHDADWLAAGDVSTLRRLGGRLPRLGLWTMAATLERREAQSPPWSALERHAWDALPVWRLHRRPWSWSIQGALAMAAHRGAVRIDVYGGDAYTDQPLTDTDCAGNRGEDRTAERWTRERGEVADTVALIGVPVHFIQEQPCKTI